MADLVPGLSPTRQQLARKLATLRAVSGLSQRAVAGKLGVSQATVLRAERGEALLSREQALAWVDATTQADERERGEVLALLLHAHAEATGYADLAGDEDHLQGQVQAKDTAARLVLSCQLVMAPGLTQTAGYATAVIPQADPANTVDHPATVAARIERQRALYEGRTRFAFLIAESVLSWSPAPGTLPEQLDRLVSISTLPSVEVGILPSRREGALAWNNFTYREPADGSDPYVTLELLHGYVTVTKPAQVGLYRDLWDRLWAAAATGSEAVEMIRRAHVGRP